MNFIAFKKNCSDVRSAAKLIALSIITANLIRNAFVDSVHLPKKMYEHLLSSSSVNSQREVCNILAFCKNVGLFNECLEGSVNKTVLKIAVNVLEKYFNSGIELKMRIIFWFSSVFCGTATINTY